MTQPTLLGLPPVIRARIFNLLLKDVTVKVLKRRPEPKNKTIRSAWAYLQICRTIREELRPWFFTRCVSETQYDVTGLEAWLDTVGPDAISRMNKVTFKCRGDCRGRKCERDADVDLTRNKQWTKSRPLDWQEPVFCDNMWQAGACWSVNEEAFNNAVDQITIVNSIRMLNKDVFLDIHASLSEDLY